jgi:hypothetical protein
MIDGFVFNAYPATAQKFWRTPQVMRNKNLKYTENAAIRGGVKNILKILLTRMFVI